MQKLNKTMLSGIILFSFSSTGCAAIGKMAAKMMTQETDSISNTAIKANYTSNLYTPDTKITGYEDLKEWQAGKHAIGVTFLKKKGIGMYKVNGNITANNKPMKYIGSGTYTIFYDQLDKNPQTINIKTKAGENLNIKIPAPKPVKLLKINGKSENITIDMQKDVTLELANFQRLSKNEKLRVSLIIETLGVRAFSDIGIFKPAKKIKIPHFAFQNAQVTSSGMGAKTGVADFRSGKNFLRVERFNFETPENKSNIPVETSSLSWSTIPITLKGKSNANPGLEVKKEYKDKNGKVDLKYKFTKPNAYYSAPLSSAKKLAVSSLVVRGTLRNVEKKTRESTTGNVRTITTTTTTRQFPKLPDAYWNQLLESTYNSIRYTMKSRNIDLIPVEKVVKSKSYQKLESFDEENSLVKIEKTYKGTKSLIPLSFGEIINNVSSTVASDRIENKLMRELGVDGLIDIVFELAIDPKSTEIKLSPNFLIKISGLPEGYESISGGQYMQGTISGKGVSFSKNEFSNIKALNRITRKSTIMSALNNALKSLEKEEEKNGYNAIWALK